MSDDEIQERILDAAEQCLLEAGYTARLHAAIAERAGLSRPTVYKHLGDQTTILEALLHREVSRFFAATESVLLRRGPLRERFIETVVFVVGYGRAHALMQKGLREDPRLVLPWYTIHAELFIERAVAFFAPYIKRGIAQGEIPDINPRVIVEWAYRLIASLLTTPGTVSLDEPGELRGFISALLDIGAVPAAK